MDDLTKEQKKEIAEGLGIRVEKFKNKGQIHVELKRMQEEIRTSLLADRIPQSFEHVPIAAWELFNVMKGALQWERDDDPGSIVAALKKWREEKPEEAALSEGYERVRMDVRANNPRQNLLSNVHAKAFVQGIMEQMIALAKRRGIKYMVTPIDESSQSSSNRMDVSAAYQELYNGRARIGLENVPETNFNGYDVWNERGDHACAVVWKAEDGK